MSRCLSKYEVTIHILTTEVQRKKRLKCFEHPSHPPSPCAEAPRALKSLISWSSSSCCLVHLPQSNPTHVQSLLHQWASFKKYEIGSFLKIEIDFKKKIFLKLCHLLAYNQELKVSTGKKPGHEFRD